MLLFNLLLTVLYLDDNEIWQACSIASVNSYQNHIMPIQVYILCDRSCMILFALLNFGQNSTMGEHWVTVIGVIDAAFTRWHKVRSTLSCHMATLTLSQCRPSSLLRIWAGESKVQTCRMKQEQQQMFMAPSAHSHMSNISFHHSMSSLVIGFTCSTWAPCTNANEHDMLSM